jgi:hypothetical protein
MLSLHSLALMNFHSYYMHPIPIRICICKDTLYLFLIVTDPYSMLIVISNSKKAVRW